MQATALLRADHEEVEALFKKFEASSDRARKARQKLVEQITKKLSVHAAIEEQLFYPAVREFLPDETQIVLEAVEEHHLAKTVLAELERMDPADERYAAKVTVLIENVRHHVEEEEQDRFPKVRDAMSRPDLEDLGERLETARKSAPTRPHPHAPDEPGANVLVGAASAVADRAVAAGKAVIDRVSP